MACRATKLIQATGFFSTVLLLVGAFPVAAQGRGAEVVTSYPPGWPHRAPWKLNRDLLDPGEARILFMVDVPKGLTPKFEALDGLADLAGRYAETDASWTLLDSAKSPRVEWRVPEEPMNDPPELIIHGPVEGSLRVPGDVEDALIRMSEVVACRDGALPKDVKIVFVRYLGSWGASYGGTSSTVAMPNCGTQRFPVIYVAQDRIARDRPPGWSRASLELRDLIHEYGHVLGLGSNPLHGRWLRTMPYGGGAHCIHRACAVATPTVKALLRGQMLDYCARCQKDIADAKEHWRTGKEFPEAAPLPQPDPAGFVATLKNYQFRPGGEAERLVGWGKVAMPPLIERMKDLPGGRYDSPRAHAARLALKIVAAEDRKRRNNVDYGSYRSPKKDLSQEVMDWWIKEGQAFVAGDSWALPAKALFPEPNRSCVGDATGTRRATMQSPYRDLRPDRDPASCTSLPDGS